MTDVLPLEARHNRLIAQSKHDHARKCDGTMTIRVRKAGKVEKEKVPCSVCKSNMEWFGELPPSMLSVVLQEHARVK